MLSRAHLLLALVLAAAPLAVAVPAGAQEAPNPPDSYIVDGSAQKALDHPCVPAKLTIDTYQNVIDEEQGFSIRGFKRR